MHRMTAHTAAVKALAWCPFQANLLASGGGTADRSIRFWNTHTGALLNSIDTGSQVSAQPCSAFPFMLACPWSAHVFWRQPVKVQPQHPWAAQSEGAWSRAGVRAAVEPAREGDPEQPRLQPEPALPLEVPLHG